LGFVVGDDLVVKEPLAALGEGGRVERAVIDHDSDLADRWSYGIRPSVFNELNIANC
jgi:hypothetical protein